MAMHTDNRSIDIGYLLKEQGDAFMHFLGGSVADGIRNIDGRGTRVDGCFNDAAKEVEFGSRRILGENSILSQ